MVVLNLPEEIEMDILSRLPVESLVRFRCVSKPFRSLISDPYFVKLHLNRSKNLQKIFWSSFPPRSIDYESLLDDDDDNNINVYNNAAVKLDCPLRNLNVFVIGSCNGLICYVVYQFNFILYNPSTRVSNELPEPPNTPRWGSIDRRGCYGFGFDSSDDDYKVVSGTYINDDASKSVRFHVFSLRHNSWRRIQDLSWSHLGTFSLYSRGIFLNGALHWLLGVIRSGQLHRLIVSFDLSKEVFSEMSLDNIIQGQTDLKLGAFKECLCVLSSSLSANNGTPVEVWLMKECGVKASWTKFITIPCSVGTFLTPLCFLTNGELLLNISSGFCRSTEFGSYNAKKNTFTKICKCVASSEAVLYVESLVSPKSIAGNDKRLHRCSSFPSNG